MPQWHKLELWCITCGRVWFDAWRNDARKSSKHKVCKEKVLMAMYKYLCWPFEFIIYYGQNFVSLYEIICLIGMSFEFLSSKFLVLIHWFTSHLYQQTTFSSTILDIYFFKYMVNYCVASVFLGLFFLDKSYM